MAHNLRKNICSMSQLFRVMSGQFMDHVGIMFDLTLYLDKLELETSQDLVIMVYNKWKWSDPFL